MLIFFTSVCSYLSGLWIGKAEKRYVRRWICAGNIVLNLDILGVYKYYDFFVDSFVTAFQHIGVHLSAETLGLLLPVGITFYTFQALSYTIDVYKKKLSATRDVVAFFAYISFFPKLVAGPIERATNLLPQFQKGRAFQYDLAMDGMLAVLVFNAANVSQDFMYDLYIFDKYRNLLTNLKYLILPVSYFSLLSDMEKGQEDWRIRKYQIYMDDTLQFRI